MKYFMGESITDEAVHVNQSKKLKKTWNLTVTRPLFTVKKIYHIKQNYNRKTLTSISTSFSSSSIFLEGDV